MDRITELNTIQLAALTGIQHGVPSHIFNALDEISMALGGYKGIRTDQQLAERRDALKRKCRWLIAKTCDRDSSDFIVVQTNSGDFSLHVTRQPDHDSLTRNVQWFFLIRGEANQYLTQNRFCYLRHTFKVMPLPKWIERLHTLAALFLGLVVLLAEYLLLTITPVADVPGRFQAMFSAFILIPYLVFVPYAKAHELIINFRTLARWR